MSTEPLSRKHDQLLIAQCPGCWAIHRVPSTAAYECDCGERVTLLDLRIARPDASALDALLALYEVARREYSRVSSGDPVGHLPDVCDTCGRLWPCPEGAAIDVIRAATPAAPLGERINAAWDTVYEAVQEQTITRAFGDRLLGEIAAIKSATYAATPAAPEALRRATRRCGWFCDADEHASAVYDKRECYCEKVAAAILAALSETSA